MAIYHLSFKIIKRNTGRTTIGASAYRSGTKLKSEFDGLTHDYTNKKGIVYSEVMLPDDAPEEWIDRSKLWNAVEKIEKAKDSQLAREIEVALPIELTMSDNIKLVKQFASRLNSDGMCVDFSIHDKNDGNPHAHILVTMRPLENGKWKPKTQKEYVCKNDSGETKNLTSEELKLLQDYQKIYKYEIDNKTLWLTNNEAANYKNCKRLSKYPRCTMYGRRDPQIELWNSEKYLNDIRKYWADLTNSFLERAGVKDRIDHRSYIEQGIDKFPMQHLGVSALQMEKRGKATDRGNINRNIIRRNVVKGMITIDKNKGKGFEHWAKVYNLQQEAKSFTLLAENSNKIKELTSRSEKIHEQIKLLEMSINDSDKILKYVYTLRKYYPIYKEYESTKAKGAFYDKNKQELNIYNTAKRQLKMLMGEGSKITSETVDNLKMKISQLRKEKGNLYNEYKELSQELAEYKTAHKNLEMAFKTDCQVEHRQINHDEKEHSK